MSPLWVDGGKRKGGSPMYLRVVGWKKERCNTSCPIDWYQCESPAARKYLLLIQCTSIVALTCIWSWCGSIARPRGWIGWTNTHAPKTVHLSDVAPIPSPDPHSPPYLPLERTCLTYCPHYHTSPTWYLHQRKRNFSFRLSDRVCVILVNKVIVWQRTKWVH